MQYRTKGNKPNIKPLAHGNSKNDTGYYHTKTSTKQLIKEKPKAFNELFEVGGGVYGCTSLGDVPRNRKQIKNERYKITNPKPNRDPLYAVMKAYTITCSVQDALEAICILANEYQLQFASAPIPNSFVYFPHLIWASLL